MSSCRRPRFVVTLSSSYYHHHQSSRERTRRKEILENTSIFIIINTSVCVFSVCVCVSVSFRSGSSSDISSSLSLSLSAHNIETEIVGQGSLSPNLIFILLFLGNWYQNKQTKPNDIYIRVSP